MTVTTAMIGRMRALRAKGLTYLAVGAIVGVSPSTAWKYSGDVPCVSRRGPRPLPDEIRSAMRRICEGGGSAASAARTVGHHAGTARKYCRDIIARRREERKMNNGLRWRAFPEDPPTESGPVTVTVKHTNRRFPALDRTTVYSGRYHPARDDPFGEARWIIDGYGEFDAYGYITIDGGRSRITAWMPGPEPYEGEDD